MCCCLHLREINAARSLLGDRQAITAIDGMEVGGLLGLTTLVQDPFNQGIAEARMTLHLIGGAWVENDLAFSPHLLARSSTGSASE